MGPKSEIISSVESTTNGHVQASRPQYLRNILEIGAIFSLILGAIWTHQGSVNLAFTIAAIVCVVAFAITAKASALQMGLTRPLSGVLSILLAGGLACGAIAAVGLALRSAGASYEVPLGRSWQYAIWALEQEFILQSVFFVRLEEMLGATAAVFSAAGIFALVHIPNPVLTPLAFLGGILFCELFRRWRNLYPLGIIHAALGLTIAASFPDKWLHHMRVGIGYLMHH